MKTLSLTQEYLLCTLNKKGKYSSMDMEKGVCLVAGGILELLIEDVVRLEGKKISTIASLPEEKEYLRTLYEQIRKKQPVKLESIVEYFSFNFSNKNLYVLIDDIGDTLEKDGCVRKETGGLFGKTTLYLPNPRAKDAVIQNIRAELLEDGEISEDIVALTALLNKSGDLSRYFSAYEKKDLKARLKNINNSSENQIVNQMVEYIEDLFALIVVAAT